MYFVRTVAVVALVVLAATLHVVRSQGVTGIDFSTGITSSQMQCLKQAGYSFAVPRVFRETCAFDLHAVENIKLAYSSGFNVVEGYIFPSFEREGCVLNATEQVQVTISTLVKNNAKVSRLWIDIEGDEWSTSDHEKNARFIDEMALAIVSLGMPTGYYLNNHSYMQILAPWTNKIPSAQLWYPHWDNKMTYDDFLPFAGFTKPNRKQYTGGITICGAPDLVDQSWSPQPSTRLVQE